MHRPRPEPSFKSSPVSTPRRFRELAASLVLFILLPGLLYAQVPVPPVQMKQAADTSGPPYGGDHEFGFAAGYSPVSGPIWGYDRNVRYLPITVRYSYLIAQKPHVAYRYSPEVTALAILHENSPSSTNPAAPISHYGSGISPVGFQVDFRPTHKVQPFFTTDAGFIYYNGRVLSPQGSQFMFTIDFGGAVNIFLKRRTALTLGYKYQHTSNANISVHNPGTDADTFFIGFSHFHTHGVP